MLEAHTQPLQDAIDALNTLQTPFNVIEANRKAGVRPDAAKMAEMRTYISRIGYSVCRWPSPYIRGPGEHLDVLDIMPG